jgi:hypothetical protein
VSSEGLRDTLKRVSIVNSTSSPLSWGETTPDAQLPAVDLSNIQRMPRQRFTETDVSADAQVSVWGSCPIRGLSANPHNVGFV